MMKLALVGTAAMALGIWTAVVAYRRSLTPQDGVATGEAPQTAR